MPFLLKKYKPKGIVVFSAHWETSGERLVSDYGDDQPLLMDFFQFPKSLYEYGFKSNGDAALSVRIVESFKKSNLPARLTSRSESRGLDGRTGKPLPGPGLDHGVYIPFSLMFGQEFTDIPIVAVSIDESLSPVDNWKIGAALKELRNEGILILSGGLDVHAFNPRTLLREETAPLEVLSFHKEILSASAKPTKDERYEALTKLPKHPGHRIAHPREEHLVPIYVAAGAGENGQAKVVSSMYMSPTIAFGL